MILITADGKTLIKLDKFDQFSIKEHKEKYTDNVYYSISGLTYNPNSTMFSLQDNWVPIMYFNKYEEAELIFKVLKDKIVEGEYCFDLQKYCKKNEIILSALPEKTPAIKIK